MKKLSTPLVLALCSAMVCVGLVGFLWNRSRPGAEAAPTPGEIEVFVDTSTPERAAESFLDAWRKRAHDVAAELTIGEAHAQVEARRRRDDALSEQERDLKRQLWDSMASERLELVIDESETTPDGLVLRGVAEGTFVGRPYRRRMEVTVVEGPEGSRVSAFAFGEILTDLPPSFSDE